MRSRRLSAAVVAALVLGVWPALAAAHGLAGEFSKRIFPDLGLTLAGDWNLLDPASNGKTESGTGNLEMTLKYQFFTSAAHETILSAAFGWEAGGTGRKKIGAESFDVFKPALLFGM